jgi:hypothetical protein
MSTEQATVSVTSRYRTAVLALLAEHGVKVLAHDAELVTVLDVWTNVRTGEQGETPTAVCWLDVNGWLGY